MTNPGGEERILRWFTGVPVATNPLILADLGALMVLLWAGVTLALALIQFFFTSLGGAHIQWAALVGIYMSLLAAALFFGLSFLIFQNRYIALYRFDEEGAYCESMRKRGGSTGEWFHWKPFPVPPLQDPPKSAKKTAPWHEVKGLHPMDGQRVFLLKSGRGTAMRVYCPDDEIYRRALSFAASKINRAKDGKTKGAPA